ncbi:hypothetical protein GCM10012275_14700 [Longimycelium tulufanense]|uniref:Uncharacterized protein n=1 Tax=Longimycelium tulufanense TaxID=907463 RepID=A0A8J3C9B0_9PSEU|nr:hypothetical protein GCM10012275_14700 [Longimycelium tulufanense]
MGVADLAQGVGARQLDRIRIVAGGQQALPLLPTHPHLLREVVAAGHGVLLGLLSHGFQGYGTAVVR